MDEDQVSDVDTRNVKQTGVSVLGWTTDGPGTWYPEEHPFTVPCILPVLLEARGPSSPTQETLFNIFNTHTHTHTHSGSLSVTPVPAESSHLVGMTPADRPTNVQLHELTY